MAATPTWPPRSFRLVFIPTLEHPAEFLHLNGLAQIIVHAGLQTEFPVAFHRMGRERSVPRAGPAQPFQAAASPVGAISGPAAPHGLGEDLLGFFSRGGAQDQVHFGEQLSEFFRDLTPPLLGNRGGSKACTLIDSRSSSGRPSSSSAAALCVGGQVSCRMNHAGPSLITARSGVRITPLGKRLSAGAIAERATPNAPAWQRPNPHVPRCRPIGTRPASANLGFPHPAPPRARLG